MFLPWYARTSLCRHPPGLSLGLFGFSHPRRMGHLRTRVHILLRSFCQRQFLARHYQLQTSVLYIHPATGEMQIWVVALPGVRILPGEELYAAYGKNYWLDHLSTLSQAARRACISKYKYRPSELLKAGLNPDGSRSPPAPSILPFLCSSPRMEPTTHALFLREETVQVNSIFRLHFAQPSLPRLLYDPALPLFEKRALLRTYFLTEPVLRLHLQEPADLYNVCAPDGSCAIQLALLYQCLDPVDWTSELLSHDHKQPYFRYRRRGQPTTPDHRDILRLVRSFIDSRSAPGSHLRASLEAWHHGLLNNFPPPILTAPQYLDIEEVLQLLPPLASASIFFALPYAPLDTVHHRVWSVLQSDTKFPARNSFFSGSELQSLLSGPMRASVLRDSHFYPFLISTAPVLDWTTSAIEELVERFFPPPLPNPCCPLLTFLSAPLSRTPPPPLL